MFNVINNFVVHFNRKYWKLKNKFIIRNYLLHLINVSSYNLHKKKIIHKHIYHKCPQKSIVYIINI